MGKIFYVMGKSASGKDTIYKLISERIPELKTVIPYTTRPIREGEREGVEYYFTAKGRFEELAEQGKVIESRTYQTVLGPWSYFTVNDGQFDDEESSRLMIGTLEAYEKVRKYFGEERVMPIYIEVEDGLRLFRAVGRERLQREPKYAELCRRFLADMEDFSEENLDRCGIVKRYNNDVLEECLEEIIEDIKDNM